VHWLDIVFLAVILLSTGFSIFRGFIKEILSLLAWLAAFFIAKTFYANAETYLVDMIATPEIRSVLAWLGLFICSLIAIGLVNHFISQVISKLGLGAIDRILGMCFGAMRGILIITIVILSLKHLTPLPDESWWQQSKLLPEFETLGDWFYKSISSAQNAN
jgi:membrane protein required for colicin V production